MTVVEMNEQQRHLKPLHTSLGLMSADEVSSVLQVSPQTLATWRCKKRGPPSIKLGKKVFYLITDFNSWTKSEAQRQQGWRDAPKTEYPSFVMTTAEALKRARENA